MKFAMVTPAGGRDAMRERHRRARAASPALRVRYPGLASVQLDFKFNDDSRMPPSSQATAMHPPAHAYFCFACPYGDCDGEFNLADPVNQVLTAHESDSNGRLLCTGKRRGGTSCSLCLDYTISVSWL